MSAEYDPAPPPMPEPLERLLGHARERSADEPSAAPAVTRPDEDGAPDAATPPRRWWRRSRHAERGSGVLDVLRAALGARGADWALGLEARGEAPVGWVIGRDAYDELTQSLLPPGHDLRSLLALAGTPTGEERCARAYDRLLAEPLPERWRLGLTTLCRAEAAALDGGLYVVPCLALPPLDDEKLDPGDLLPLVGPVYTLGALLDAVRTCWAAGVLHAVVGECARAGASELSMALLIVPAEQAVRMRGTTALGAPHPDEPELHPSAWASPGSAVREGRPGPVRPIFPSTLRGDGLTRLSASALLPIVATVLTDLGRRHALDPDEVRAVAVLRGAEPFIDAERLAECLRGVPRALGDLLLAGLGLPESAAPGEIPSLWARGRALRGGLAAARGVAESTSLAPTLVEPLLSAAEPALFGRLEALADIDLGLLPTDALGTSLENALAVVRDALGLWLRSRAAELALQASIAALARARVPGTTILTGVAMSELGKTTLPSDLADELAEAAALVAVDRTTASALHAGVRSLDELPAGATRGSLQQLVTSFGDWCARPWELGVARWSEDPSELFALVRAASVLSSNGPGPPALRPRQRRANALAAGRDALARLEPSLSTVERVAVRAMLGRLDDLVARRRPKDRALLRALALARRVVCEVDGRLARYGGRTAPGGAFFCALEPLRRALETDTLEIGRLIQMRQAEERLEAGPRADAPRVPMTAPAEAPLAGVGASPGLVVGRACVVTGAELPAVEPGAVLVVHHLAPTWGGLVHVAAAVVSETDVPLSAAAQLCRALGAPLVCCVRDATRAVCSGDRVRLDGARGIVERLE